MAGDRKLAANAAAKALGAVLDALDELGLSFDLAADLPALARALAEVAGSPRAQAHPDAINMLEIYLQSSEGGGLAESAALEECVRELGDATTEIEEKGRRPGLTPWVSDLAAYHTARRQMELWTENMRYVVEQVGVSPEVLAAAPDDPRLEALRAAWRLAWQKVTRQERPSRLTYVRRGGDGESGGRWYAVQRVGRKVRFSYVGKNLPASALGEPSARKRLLVAVAKRLRELITANSITC